MTPPVLKSYEREYCKPKQYRIVNTNAIQIFISGLIDGDIVELADVPGKKFGYHPNPLCVTVCRLGKNEQIGVKRSQIEEVK